MDLSLGQRERPLSDLLNFLNCMSSIETSSSIASKSQRTQNIIQLQRKRNILPEAKQNPLLGRHPELPDGAVLHLPRVGLFDEEGPLRTGLQREVREDARVAAGVQEHEEQPAHALRAQPPRILQCRTRYSADDHRLRRNRAQKTRQRKGKSQRC